MLDFILYILCHILCCFIGCYLGMLFSNYLLSKNLKHSIFSKSDFIDVDDDFFGDSKSSITDINIDNKSIDNTSIDNTSIDNTSIDDNKPKFF